MTQSGSPSTLWLFLPPIRCLGLAINNQYNIHKGLVRHFPFSDTQFRIEGVEGGVPSPQQLVTPHIATHVAWAEHLAP
ncbi:hypothetical protein BGZ61DRAFT_137180 [Ilyonectria robusta]|uniref:uncharacterized protein n=1 Tax=Ilyonectria robusta TaxID=1079257 RepID=UPI001E8E7DA7|nr:uncharacterized protein BGZ61DRAFT_137180 [Ilyonectria robusta]KAH8735224.1 hypothetical protein BGZ61DRAFT_137180 [Ilyonectria robusta]